VPPNKHFTKDDRSKIETLILAFNNRGCSLGLDIQAQPALDHFLTIVDEAEKYRALIEDRGGNVLKRYLTLPSPHKSY
jgi:hypothetical protein